MSHEEASLESSPMESSPLEVRAMIADKLHGNDKVNLALCCKAMLPTLCTGTVSVRLDKPAGEEPLIQLSQCLSRQPGGVLHLRLFSTGHRVDTHNLIGLSVLSKLHKLSLNRVTLSLPALQPIATRLESLCMSHTSLEDSAEGFLGVNWSALKSLSVESCLVDDNLTALTLPALESLDISEFSVGDGDMLQPGQLFCPQLRSLAIDILDNSQDPAPESSGSRTQWGGLLHLPRLETLFLTYLHHQAPMDLGLPASIEHLTVRLTDSFEGVDLQWLLLEAGKSGAQLRSLTCPTASASSHPEGMPWGASSVARYKKLAEQLRGLKDLSVHGNATTLVSAIGVIACSAPDLTHLDFEFPVGVGLNDFELPTICSASLRSITGRFRLTGHRMPPPPVIINFLPGCTKLRVVLVQLHDNHHMPVEGTSIRIRCHCTSQRCIMPLDACTGLEVVGVRFLPMLPASQVMQAYTIIFACHAAGPEQALNWYHVVVPGVL